MKRGTRKYRCAECAHEQGIHFTALDRRSKTRCERCGSLWLDPVSPEALKEIVDKSTNRVIGPKESLGVAISNSFRAR